MGEFASRILVVDDDPIVAESMAEFLRAEGYEAATALNAGEALESLAEAEKTPPASGQPIRPFSLVISDVSMPATDGLSLLREIKRRHRGVVMLMVTGYGTIETAVEAVRLGASTTSPSPSSTTSFAWRSSGPCGSRRSWRRTGRSCASARRPSFA
jgi:two-component system nitrogen regulation response regulator NtrX